MILLTFLALAAYAENRVALVIGNWQYKVMPLKNPENDAKALERKLRELGFDVTLKLNAGIEEMERSVAEFARKLGRRDVGLFFYAGHGAQFEGINYLISTDFAGQDEVAMKRLSLSVSDVQRRMEQRETAFNILILDACRNNPVQSSTRSAVQGLARLEARTIGTFVAFATADGKTAADNAAGQNGLFTTHLLRAMEVKGLGLHDLFREVKRGVITQSGGKQNPFVYENLIDEFYLLPGEAAPVHPVAAPKPAPVMAEPARTAVASPASVSLSTRVLGEPGDYSLVIEGNSAQGSTLMGEIEVEIGVHDGLPEVTRIRGDLPLAPVTISSTRSENARAVVPIEVPSAINGWRRLRYKIQPDDPAKPVRLTIDYRGIAAKNSDKRR